MRRAAFIGSYITQDTLNTIASVADMKLHQIALKQTTNSFSNSFPVLQTFSLSIISYKLKMSNVISQFWLKFEFEEFIAGISSKVLLVANNSLIFLKIFNVIVSNFKIYLSWFWGIHCWQFIWSFCWLQMILKDETVGTKRCYIIRSLQLLHSDQFQMQLHH